MVFPKYMLLVAGLALVVACGGMSATGDPDHWHAKVYRGTEGKVGEQKSSPTPARPSSPRSARGSA